MLQSKWKLSYPVEIDFGFEKWLSPCTFLNYFTLHNLVTLTCHKVFRNSFLGINLFSGEKISQKRGKLISFLMTYMQLQYQQLASICQHRAQNLAEVIRKNPLSFSFRWVHCCNHNTNGIKAVNIWNTTILWYLNILWGSLGLLVSRHLVEKLLQQFDVEGIHSREKSTSVHL